MNMGSSILGLNNTHTAYSKLALLPVSRVSYNVPPARGAFTRGHIGPGIMSPQAAYSAPCAAF